MSILLRVLPLLSLLSACHALELPSPKAIDSADQCVILLHGLSRSSGSMAVMADALRELGYRVVNDGYPSHQQSIPGLVEMAIPPALAKCAEATQVHFVTHSLGGILTRYYLQENTLDNLGHVVMLGPPNQGSEVVDKLKKIPGFGLITGKAGQELGTDDNSVPRQLGAVTYPVGVIAGTRSIDPISSALIPGDDDGKVAVQRTQLDGMRDFIVLPVTHAFMMMNPTVIQQTVYFLQNGHFFRP
jgi:pimeloyl-ACP methyl ester carboxylesterase